MIVLKKKICKKCGGILIPNGLTYICEDCRAVYNEDDLKAISMQINVKPLKRVEPKKEEEPKGFTIKKPIPIKRVEVEARPKVAAKVEEVKPKLIIKNPKIKEEAPVLKKVKAIRPIGVGEDPKDGISNEMKLNSKIDDNSILSSLLILAKDAMDNKNYNNAISYCDKILRIDIDNRNAYLIKAEAIINSDNEIDYRLSKAIEYYTEALKRTDIHEYDDLSYRINMKYIEVVKEYLINKLIGFKETLDSNYLSILKSELKHLDKFARTANKELGLDLKLHYEILASEVINLVGSVSKKAIDGFNLEKMRQTDDAYIDFKNKMDGCIRIWEYTLTFSIRAKTILEALDNLYKAHYDIINSCGHKLSGKKLKVSITSSAEEKILREARINGYKTELRKYYLLDDDRVDSKSFDQSLKELNNKKKSLLRKLHEFKEIKEIKELEEMNKFLAQSGRFKEAKENLGKINSLNRELLSKSRNLNLELEGIERKILSLSIDNLYLNLD